MSFTFKGASAKNNLASVSPMLAATFDKVERFLRKGKKIYLQPKLDGVRCVAGKIDGVVYLYSRNGKPFGASPHIIQELVTIMNDGEIWDGELFHKDLEFNDISHFVRPHSPVRGGDKIEYHVFDAVVFDKTFEERYLQDVAKRLDEANLAHVKSVPTIETTYDKEAMDAQHDQWVQQGYEGLMIRVASTRGYETKRTNDLIKYKLFKDAEFKVVGCEEGKGQLTGHLGAFVLEVEVNGKKETFNAKPDGEHSILARIWKEQDQWIGKMVTCKYQALSQYGIPRFPIVKGIRFDLEQ